MEWRFFQREQLIVFSVLVRRQCNKESEPEETLKVKARVDLSTRVKQSDGYIFLCVRMGTMEDHSPVGIYVSLNVFCCIVKD